MALYLLRRCTHRGDNWEIIHNHRYMGWALPPPDFQNYNFVIAL